MIGINTSISRKAADGVAITDVNFALKSSVAVRWLNGIGHTAGYGETKVAESVIRQEPVKPTSTPPKAKEKVVGKKLDVAKAKKKQKVLTPKRPFSLKQLRQKQIRELENLMDEMRMR